MGISITATNTKFDFDMGYGGFFSLRRNIALALDQEFGENYSALNQCHTESQFAENDKVANEIIKKKHLDENYKEVIEFLYSSDVYGSISYKTCKQIYDLIKDVNFGNKGFRYAAYMDHDYNDFKEFLKECYSHRRKMRWS